MDPTLRGVLSPEARVLVLTAGGGESDPLLAEALRVRLDWSRLSWLAEWERATGVVWRRLASVDRDRIPDDVAQAWERLAMVADFHALYLHDRFVQTLDALNEAGIDVVLLKGAALALGTYGSFTERPMGDVDLLVSPSKVRSAWDVALSLGWAWDQRSFPSAMYEEHHHLPPLLDGRRTGAKLELHTALSVFGHPFSLGFDAVRAVAREIPLGTGTKGNGHSRAFVLDESHQIVHLCVHFAWSHMLSFGAWRMFRDLNALLEQGQVDWDRVCYLARVHGATSSCYWTLRLAGSLAGVQVPEGVIRRLQAPVPPGMGSLLERHLTTQLFASERSCPSESVRRWMWSSAIRPGRLQLGEGRPWDIDDVTREPSIPRLTLRRRLGRQLEHFMRWAHYVRLMAVPH